MAVNETLKNMAVAATVAALKMKYGRPAPKKPEGMEPDAEIGKLLDKLNAAKVSLNTGIDRLIARAGKGGVSNYELIKMAAMLNAIAKTMG